MFLNKKWETKALLNKCCKEAVVTPIVAKGTKLQPRLITTPKTQPYIVDGTDTSFTSCLKISPLWELGFWRTSCALRKMALPVRHEVQAAQTCTASSVFNKNTQPFIHQKYLGQLPGHVPL